jgi:hypothetical protein
MEGSGFVNEAATGAVSELFAVGRHPVVIEGFCSGFAALGAGLCFGAGRAFEGVLADLFAAGAQRDSSHQQQSNSNYFFHIDSILFGSFYSNNSIIYKNFQMSIIWGKFYKMFI